jgi:hypothetical protein
MHIEFFPRKTGILVSVLTLGLFLAPMCFASKPNGAFAQAQACHINETVDYGCFQQRLPIFEKFVLQDDAGWLQKSIVADGLVKTYDAMHVSSPNEAAVRAKERIYKKATAVLDKGELGEIDDCKDEGNPDACLRFRYCFKEAYIKIKNVLVTNEPERFQAEIKWFDREIKGNC